MGVEKVNGSEAQVKWAANRVTLQYFQQLYFINIMITSSIFIEFYPQKEEFQFIISKTFQYNGYYFITIKIMTIFQNLQFIF